VKEVDVMKKATVLAIGSLALLLGTGPGFVEATGQNTSASAPAEKPSRLALSHHVTGEVMLVDKSAKTLTVKDAKGKEFMFTADADAAPRLSDVKTGDRVKVSYKKSHGQMVATKITETRVARSSTK
jgi:Cu/Ag efflux protein CusF